MRKHGDFEMVLIRPKLLSLLLIALLFFAVTNRTLADDTQIWTTVSATGKISTAGRYYLEAQPRYDHEGDRFEKLILRGALGYVLAPGLTGWAGYGWFPQYQTALAERNFTNENRLWQQLAYEHQVLEATVNHRLRLEERRIGDEPQVSNRGRYLLRGSLPFGEYHGLVYGLTAFDEVFVNLHGMHRGPIGGFDRNRYVIGPYFKWHNYRIETGYLREESRGRGGVEREINAAAVSIGLSF